MMYRRSYVGLILLDFFTVLLRSRNSRQIACHQGCASDLWKMIEIPTGHVKPQHLHCDWGYPNDTRPISQLDAIPVTVLLSPGWDGEIVYDSVQALWNSHYS